MSKTDNSVNEHVSRMMQKVRYRINETPKYTQLNPDDFKNDDSIPVIPKNDSKVLSDAPIAEADNEVSGSTETPPVSIETPIVTPVDPMINNVLPQEETPNEIQNDIIKLNIAAMRDLQDKISGLDSYVQNLNQNVSKLSSEVEEVREPSTSEKLMSKKDVSYPYYFNLNDFWKRDNWFDKSREDKDEHGIRQLPDGTYIADFDDLPKYSSNDINNSFNDRDITVQ
jgi:hypothetical protein